METQLLFTDHSFALTKLSDSLADVTYHVLPLQEVASLRGQLVAFVPLLEVWRERRSGAFHVGSGCCLVGSEEAGFLNVDHFLPAAPFGSFQDPIKNIIKSPT